MQEWKELKFAHDFDRYDVPIIRRSVIPVFAANRKALDTSGTIHVVEAPPIAGIATGTLFQFDGVHYLVTAAHVVHDFTSDGRELRLGMGEPIRPRPIPLSAEDVQTDDALDVAVVRLRPEVVLQLQNRSFLTPQHLANVSALEDARFFLPGYLWDGSQPSPDHQSFVLHNHDLWTRAYTGTVNRPDYDAALHCLLEYGNGGWSPRDGSQTAPQDSLGGMSGASIWRVFLPEHVDTGWSTESLKVVAMQTRVIQKKRGPVIGGTFWTHILPIIESMA